MNRAFLDSRFSILDPKMSIGDKRIYLASRSPRRRELLKQIGVPFELLLLREDLRRGADVDETPLPDESPGVYVLRLAGAKVKVAVRQIAYRGLPQKPVLAADTTVVFDDRIIGKPENAEHAARMLRALSGREHQVLTAVALALREQVETQISVSSVWFNELTDTDIRRYVESGDMRGMQSGFIDIGGELAAFLHVADIRSGRENGDSARPIERLLSEGQNLLVQVVKDPIGTKGARLSTQISIAGRFLVYLPQESHIGISQRIEDEEERAHLREQLRQFLPPGEKGGVILAPRA